MTLNRRHAELLCHQPGGGIARTLMLQMDKPAEVPPVVEKAVPTPPAPPRHSVPPTSPTNAERPNVPSGLTPRTTEDQPQFALFSPAGPPPRESQQEPPPPLLRLMWNVLSKERRRYVSHPPVNLVDGESNLHGPVNFHCATGQQVYVIRTTQRNLSSSVVTLVELMV